MIYTKKCLHTASSMKSLFMIKLKKSPLVTSSMQNIAHAYTVRCPFSLRDNYASPAKLQYRTRPGCCSF